MAVLNTIKVTLQVPDDLKEIQINLPKEAKIDLAITVKCGLCDSSDHISAHCNLKEIQRRIDRQRQASLMEGQWSCDLTQQDNDK